MARALVTGGAGFIGSHLVDALQHRGHQVMVLDDFSAGKRDHLPLNTQIVRDDIRSPRVHDLFRDFQPEYVFHLAAQKSVQQSLKDPVHDAGVNITGSLNIITLSHKFKVKKLIFSSTGGAIYGPSKQIPTTEKSVPHPESPYGIAKYSIEQYLDIYRTSFGLRSVSLRYANVYGPRQDPEGEAGVVAIFCQRLADHDPLTIYGDGKQTRDYVYVSDVVEANILAMQRSAQGPINIGTGIQTNVNILAERLRKISGQRARIVHRAGLPGEVRRSALDCRLAKRELGWKPTVKLLDGLAKTWQGIEV